MSTITKDVIITKLYSSDTDATLEARQFTTFEGMLNRMTPAPQTWDLKAAVKKADVFKAKTATDKARVVMTITVTGEEDRIDAWVGEYKKLHGTQVNTRQQDVAALQQASEDAANGAK